MKLISFAVISFLAITVSAYPHQGAGVQDLEESPSTPSQDLEESPSTFSQDLEGSQSTTTQSEQEYQSATTQGLSENSRQSLQDKLDKLTKEYKAKQAAASELQNTMDGLETRMSDIGLRANIPDGPGMMDLVREFLAKNSGLAKARASKKALEREMDAILKECDDLVKGTTSSDETRE
ncbi:hypothetical protein BASA50_008225 [Batrachochytrium salamandrivorans]|uniref:Uncharacterized protein n=1 Tax=Batrachochytrium salamandrivorans TaxID=1357716 RepID=A0ABQ8F4S0_9FUNG|nr:hypothetical protein BASA50_008225 [Batrachochytrium salamandrivorans]KAH9263691.1 hypothetical protein BASA83_012902 [Batrachochytrium salamandrivorans]